MSTCLHGIYVTCWALIYGVSLYPFVYTFSLCLDSDTTRHAVSLCGCPPNPAWFPHRHRSGFLLWTSPFSCLVSWLPVPGYFLQICCTHLPGLWFVATHLMDNLAGMLVLQARPHSYVDALLTPSSFETLIWGSVTHHISTNMFSSALPYNFSLSYSGRNEKERDRGSTSDILIFTRLCVYFKYVKIEEAKGENKLITNIQRYLSDNPMISILPFILSLSRHTYLHLEVLFILPISLSYLSGLWVC